jgi:glycosyltransferase involved in cell wall biosynthesis
MDRKIRILLTVPHLHSTQSPYRELIAIVRYLPRDEFDLTVCALRDTPNENTVSVLNSYRIPWMIARFRPRGKTFKKVMESIKDQAIIDQKGPFDIQHSLDFTSSPFEAFMARRRGRRYIFNQRNMNEGGKSTLLRLKALFADKIIAISDHTVKFMRHHSASASKLEKIYNGIDLQDIKTHDVSSEPLPFKRFVLSVGHVERRKRHEDAIQAIAMINSKENGIHLAIAGGVHDQKYYEELQSIIQKLNINDRVSFLGIRKDIIGLMKRAEALVLCSESEGVPWVLLEAMAVGLPIVASNIEGTNEAVLNGKTGILVPLANVKEYAQALSTLLSDPNVRETFAENSRKLLLERFSAQGMVENVAMLYRRLINPQTSSASASTYQKINIS